MANEKIIREWFRLAVRDLRSGIALQHYGSQFKRQIAFTAQQCVEKTLKGCLIHKGERPPKTHDIEALAGLIEKWNPKLGQLARSAKILTGYAVAYRYSDVEKNPITVAKATAAL